MEMNEIIVLAVFFGVPAASVVWLIVSLVRFIRTPKEEVKKWKVRRLLLIFSALAAFIFVGGAAMICYILTQAVMYM